MAAASLASDAAAQPITRGARFFSVFGGASFKTSNGPHFALVRNRRVFMGSVQAEWVVTADSNVAFATTLEVPVSLIVPRPGAATQECWWRTRTGTRECYAIDRPHAVVAAVGATPIGFKMYVWPTSSFRPFVSIGGGFAAFNHNTPILKASALNFAADYMLGVELQEPEGQGAMIVAWKFQHWSNANLAAANPGMDVNLLYVGFKKRG